MTIYLFIVLLSFSCYGRKKQVLVSSAPHLGFYQSGDDGFKGLMSVAGQDSLKVLRAMLQRLGHSHVQVVVCLLCSQILLEGKLSVYDVSQ